MNEKNLLPTPHPLGDSDAPEIESLVVDTFGGRVHVEWAPQAAVTPLGQLPFFIEFLKTARLFDAWVQDCPLEYHSPNAPAKRDILGTTLLCLLAGHTRYAHIAAIRADGVNPELLGMSKVASEDSVRRAFQAVDGEECALWQTHHLRRCYEALLCEPWILDLDTTVKPLYGHQEGAVKGYNPQKPGRPSHTYHTYFLANLRLVLDVEVQPGNQTAAKYTSPSFFAFLDRLSPEQRPVFVRGDCAFGNDAVMRECEKRGQPYLFKLRQTQKVRGLIEKLFARAEWEDAGQRWEGVEAKLRLSGWERERKVVVLRRRLKGDLVLAHRPQPGQLELAFVETLETVGPYEYAVLVTDLAGEILTLAQHYRDRADCENVFDELKNQWGWGGFTSRDQKRCQIMARHTALVYNWWSLFARLALPDKHHEAQTSRPLLLHAVGKQTQHAGQTTLTLTSLHAESASIRKVLRDLTGFFQHLHKAAEQLDWTERWRLILSRAFVIFLKGRLLGVPGKPALGCT
jgi:hypothetical protein